MVQPVLHPNKVREGTHCPEIILPGPPSDMVDRLLSEDGWVIHLVNNSVSVSDCNDLVFLEDFICLVIDVSVEGQDFGIITLEVQPVVSKSIYVQVIIFDYKLATEAQELHPVVIHIRKHLLSYGTVIPGHLHQLIFQFAPSYKAPNDYWSIIP